MKYLIGGTIYALLLATFLLLALGAGYARYEGPLNDEAWRMTNQPALLILGAGWLLTFLRSIRIGLSARVIVTQLVVLVLVVSTNSWEETQAGVQRVAGTSGPLQPIMRRHPNLGQTMLLAELLFAGTTGLLVFSGWIVGTVTCPRCAAITPRSSPTCEDCGSPISAPTHRDQR